MPTQWLLLAALIVSALRPSTQHERGAVPTSRVTIVERLRSEFLSVLIGEPGTAQDVSLPATMYDPYLTRAGSTTPATDADSGAEASTKRPAIEEAGGLPRPHSPVPRGGICWWLWLLFGDDFCGDPIA